MFSEQPISDFAFSESEKIYESELRDLYKIIGRAPSRKLTKRGGKRGLPVILVINPK